jgi:hypothetical protein
MYRSLSDILVITPVLKLIASTLISFGLIINPVAAMSGTEGQYFFRYKSGVETTNSDDVSLKDITAFYVGGVGQSFSEKLPMKPQWEDDRWEVSSGTLPHGVTFNASTLTFEGIPSQVIADHTVTLRGYDANNSEVASANATFSFYELPANTVAVDIYAHKDRYFFEELKLPSGVAINGDIKLLTPLPPGVSFNARYFQGTPTAGRLEPYPVVAIGYDYMGEPVIAFTGRIRVAEELEFNTIPDDLRVVSYRGSARYPAGFAWWHDEALPKVKRAIKDASKVRYAVEYDPDHPLPGTLRVGGTSFDKILSGGTENFYEQGQIRLTATDTDGIKGKSNWFRLGSLGPQALCTPYQSASIKLRGTAGTPFASYRIPSGNDSAFKNYRVTSGSLPTNLHLDELTGVISGTPDKKQDVRGVGVEISFPNAPQMQSVQCGPYDFKIGLGGFDLQVSAYQKEFRKGGSVSVSFTPTGVLGAASSVKMVNDNLPAGYSFDSSALTLTGGAIDQPGFYSASFILDNGDGDAIQKTVAFTVRDNLDINDPPAQVSIRQYDSVDQLYQVTYDANTVVYPGSEVLSQNGGNLPAGMTFNSVTGIVSGGTTYPPLSGEKPYGPFSYTLSDSTGESVSSNPVDILVTERADLISNETVQPTFKLNLSSAVKPFSVTQPPLAVDLLPLKYTLIGPDLPTGLVFSETTGTISGTPIKVETKPGYSVKIEEISADNLSKVSETFSVAVEEVGPIQDITLNRIEGNAPGSSTNGVSMPILTSADPMPRLAAIRDQLQGFETSVQFGSVDALPPGMSYNSATGTVSGTPDDTYAGTVTINYEDGGARPGKILVPVTIYPFPIVGPVKASFDLPRLSLAQQNGIRVAPVNNGFYRGLSWTIAPGSDPLPDGLSMVQTGDAFILSGRTSVPETDQPIIIKVRGTSTANGLSADTSFLLNITPREDMKFSLPQKNLVIRMDEQVSAVVSRTVFTPDPLPTGSYVPPVRWTVSDNPTWMTIDQKGQIGGVPNQLGDWTATITATDAEGISVSDTVSGRTTLAGNLAITPGGSTATPVRIGEVVRFPDEAGTLQTFSNVVLPLKSISAGSGKPASILVDQITGVQTGYVSQPGTYSWPFQVVDSHDRTLYQNGVYFGVTVVPALEITGTISSERARQYDPAKPVSVSFPSARNGIGKVSYSVIGDIPGTLYTKVYPTDQINDFYYQQIVDDAVVAVIQPNGRTAEEVESTLALDRIIFDTMALTLKGIPSRSGTFNVTMVAYDDHEKNGYKHSGNIGKAVNNSAMSQSATIIVDAASDFIATNTLTSETLHQFTSTVSAKVNVSGDAYGLGVKRWEKISETLPSGVTAAPGVKQLGWSGYPEVKGSFNGSVYRAYDYADRLVETLAIPFVVTDRLTLALTSSPGNPRYMIVNENDAAMRVSAINRAYGKSIGKANWSVSGVSNLPPGVTYTIDDDGVSFSGISDTIGKYEGFHIVARDAKGATASMALTFNVISSPEAIILNVSNITTKVGYPVLMEPPFAAALLSTDNTYGGVRFYSNDLPSIEGISLNGATGNIDGQFDTVQKLNFDLFVTDDTNRVTSKPVLVDVIPNLRLLVPTLVSAEQGEPLTQSISTDYSLGTVTYKKGQGDWPIGVDVDPVTGRLISKYTDPVTAQVTTKLIAEAKTYSGLTIIGEDAFGTFVDRQSSNAFSIIVQPTTAVPQIADQAKTILGVVDTSLNWTPASPAGWSKHTVEQGKPGNAWNYAGTRYTASHNLTQYGLTFDEITGKITGTPTQAFIIRDFVITVTSQLGDVDATIPFWIGVAPKDAIVPEPGQTLTKIVRVGKGYSTDAPRFQNVIGIPIYTLLVTPGPNTFSTATGVLSNPLVKAADIGDWPAGVRITDEFNRTGQIDTRLKVVAALGLTGGIGDIGVDKEPYVSAFQPVTTGLIGTATYSVTGLPLGLTGSTSDGSISGVLDDRYKLGDTFTVTYKVTDGGDNEVATKVNTIKIVDGFTYFRIADSTPRYYRNGTSAGFHQAQFWEGSTEVTAQLIPGRLSWLALDVQPYELSGRSDDLHVLKDATGVWWKSYKFNRPVNITKVQIRNYLAWQGTNTSFKNPRFLVSKDGVTWTQAWAHAGTWTTAIVQTSTKP